MYSMRLCTYICTVGVLLSVLLRRANYHTPFRTHIVIKSSNCTGNITVICQKTTHHFHDRGGPGGEELDGFNGHFIHLPGGVVILSELAAGDDL